MAARPQLRRKTTWPGFFTTVAPVDLPGAHLDEDADVYERVKHLQRLRAVQDALDETDVRNTRPGYNPQLDDLFGDPLADRSRFTDVFGRELGIGQTLDALRDEYGPGHVPGDHNDDPGDPRGSSRTGMASEDEPSSSHGAHSLPTPTNSARKPKEEETLLELIQFRSNLVGTVSAIEDVQSGMAPWYLRKAVEPAKTKAYRVY